MNCKRCGNQLADNARVCGKCGQTVARKPVQKTCAVTTKEQDEYPLETRGKSRKRGNEKKKLLKILLTALIAMTLIVVAVLVGWFGINTLILPDPIHYLGVTENNIGKRYYGVNELELTIEMKSKYSIEAIDAYIELLKSEYNLVEVDGYYDPLSNYSPYAALDKNHFHHFINEIARDTSPYSLEIQIKDKQHIKIIYGNKIQFTNDEIYSWDDDASYVELTDVQLPNPALFFGVDTPFPDRFLSGFEVYDPGKEKLNAYIHLLCDSYEMEIQSTEQNRYRLQHQSDPDFHLVIAIDESLASGDNTYYLFSGNCSVIAAEIYPNIT